MTAGNSAFGSMAPLLWFGVVVVAIPVLLWLLKRTPIGGGAAHSLMRSVAMLPVSNSQRIVTIEVGTGDDRRWLVLGVTPSSITTLHTMAPQSDAPSAPVLPAMPAFADVFAKLRKRGGGDARAGADHG